MSLASIAFMQQAALVHPEAVSKNPP
jgi:hypothetical protein